MGAVIGGHLTGILHVVAGTSSSKSIFRFLRFGDVLFCFGDKMWTSSIAGPTLFGRVFAALFSLAALFSSAISRCLCSTSSRRCRAILTRSSCSLCSLESENSSASSFHLSSLLRRRDILKLKLNEQIFLF